MKLLSKLCAFFLVVLSFFPAFTSAQFNTSSPIYAGSISSDKSKIALVDSEHIFILKSNNLEEIWSIPCNHKTHGLVTEIFFLPNNDSLVCYRVSKFNGDLESDLNLIYFSDSLYVGNFVSRSLQSYPGNVHASFGANSGDFCVFANFGHEFNFNNQTNWWADGAFLFTKEFENIQLQTPVSKCALSRDGEKIAILTRSENAAKPNELQVFDIHSQKIIYTEVLPEQYYTNLQFSTEGNSVYLESCRLFSSSLYQNYIGDLEDVKDTIISIYSGTNVQLENVVGKQEQGIRLLPTGDEFKIIDAKTQKELHVFWANACNLFNIHNAFLLNENEVIVYGSFSDYSGSAPSGAANKMKLTDVSAFTKIDDSSGGYKLFEPNEVRVLSNTSNVNPTEISQVVIGQNKKIVYVIQDRTIEMWDLENLYLLRRFAFESSVSIATDGIDSMLFVLEKHEKSNSDNIRLHQINLHTGDVTFSIQLASKVDEYIRNHSSESLVESEVKNLFSALKRPLPWELKNEKKLFKESISADSQEFALVQNQLLNFKTLENCAVKNLSNLLVLDNAYVGLCAELHTKKYWSLEENTSKAKSTSFIIKEILPNGDTLAISPGFKLRVNPSYYQCQFTRSSTSRYACALVNDFFQEANCDLYVFDIQKNQVHEFLSVGLSSIVFNENDSLFQIITCEFSSRGEPSFSYELYDTETFKKQAHAKTSFFEFGNAPKNTLDLIAPERDFDAVYIHSVSNKKSFGFFPTGKMFVWKDGDLSPHTSVSLGSGKALYCSFVGENIFVVLESREAFFIDPKTAKVVCTILFLPNEETTDILWFLPDGSFYAPKNTIPKFHMVKGKNAYPLLNYEALLNRPDRILSAIGLADAETIEAFGMAYQKRNNKFKIQTLDFNINIPTLRWKSKIPQELSDSLISFSITLDHPDQEPLTAHVLINGVPVYGMSGIPIEPNKTEFTCTTALENGKNEILIYVQNGNGVKSFPISKEITSTYGFQRRLFFVGIGVSEYVDSVKNLTFAHSDVLKLGEEFVSAYDNRCQRLLLTNSDATRENILNVKTFLEKTNVNDMVVLAFAGHGTIGNNREFYFCPNDVNFKSPENSGVSYAEIEELLDSIPARKKLLLLDACHSGEIDSSYTPVFVSGRVKKKDGRGIDVIEIEETTGEKQINFLIESLFSNLNSGTGAFVISASAGSEYAFETEQTGGVFTYSFLESFKTHFYSYTPDPFITTLQQETYQKVIELTKGAQRPTTRAENTRNVWKFEQ